MRLSRFLLPLIISLALSSCKETRQLAESLARSSGGDTSSSKSESKNKSRRAGSSSSETPLNERETESPEVELALSAIHKGYLAHNKAFVRLYDKGNFDDINNESFRIGGIVHLKETKKLKGNARRLAAAHLDLYRYEARIFGPLTSESKIMKLMNWSGNDPRLAIRTLTLELGLAEGRAISARNTLRDGREKLIKNFLKKRKVPKNLQREFIAVFLQDNKIHRLQLKRFQHCVVGMGKLREGVSLLEIQPTKAQKLISQGEREMGKAERLLSQEVSLLKSSFR